MSALDVLLLLALATVPLALVGGSWRGGAVLLVVAYGAQGVALLQCEPRAAPVVATLGNHLFGAALSWRYDAASWLLALLVVGAALTNAWSMAARAFAPAPWRAAPAPRAPLALALQVAALLWLLGAGDMLTFVFGWSMWLAVGPLCLSGAAAWREAHRAALGATLLLGACGLVLAQAGAFDLATLRAALPALDAASLGLLGLLWGAAFALKLGGAAPCDAPAGLLLRIVGTAVVFYGFTLWWLGPLAPQLSTLALFGVRFQDGALALAAALLLVPIYFAGRAPTLWSSLAWLGLAQLGYPWLGVLTGSALGTAGALLHLFTDVLAHTALWLTLGIVAQAAGVRVPLTRAVVAIALLSLVGLPPCAGFVAKWLIWQSLSETLGFAAQAAMALGWLGTAWAAYRVWRASWVPASVPTVAVPAGLLAPALGLVALLVLIGTLPGGALRWVAAAQAAWEWPVVRWHLGGVPAVIDMPWLALGGVALGGLGAVLWRRRGSWTSRILRLFSP